MKCFLLALIVVGSLSGFAEAQVNPAWSSLSVDERVNALEGYSTAPRDVEISRLSDLNSIRDPEVRRFADSMIKYIDENSEEYNPDFPFDDTVPSQIEVLIARDKSSGQILTGHIYIARTLVEDAGNAWIAAAFDYPLTYIGRWENSDDSLDWSHL